jgi:hypothetical protein
MRHPRVTSHPVFEEDRGALLAVELADVPFGVRRAFVVTGPPGGADRGDHPAPCAEAIVLVSGCVTLRIGSPDAPTADELCLDAAGQSAVVRRGEHVSYRLHDEHSRILVLAEEPYEGRDR